MTPEETFQEIQDLKKDVGTVHSEVADVKKDVLAVSKDIEFLSGRIDALASNRLWVITIAAVVAAGGGLIKIIEFVMA